MHARCAYALAIAMSLTLTSGLVVSAEQTPEQTPDAADVDHAKQLYRRGVEAYEAGRFAEAIDLFLQADKTVPHPAYPYNVAVAYDDIGDVGNALRWYRIYRQRAPEESHAATDEAIERLQKKLEERGVQQVSVQTKPSGATVTIDRLPVGVTPWTGEIPPGRHALTLTLEGHEKKSVWFHLLPDQAQDLSYELKASRQNRLRDPDGDWAKDDSVLDASKVRNSTWYTLGAGAVALVGAGFYDFRRRSAEDDAENAATPVEEQDYLDTAHARRNKARALATVGGALAVAGGALLVLDLSATKKDSSASKRSSARSAVRVLQLGCTVEQCGAMVNGSF